MCIEIADTPPEPVSEPPSHPISSLNVWAPQPGEVLILQPLLTHIAKDTAAALGSVDCTIQLRDSPRSLRTIASSHTSPEVLWHTQFAVGAGIAGHVAHTGEPLVVPDVSRAPLFLVLGREQRGAMASVPIADETTFYGTLTARSDEVGVFDEASVAILQRHAATAAALLPKSLQLSRQEIETGRPAALLAFVRHVTTREDILRVLDLTLSQVFQIVPFSAGVLIIDGDENRSEAAVFTTFADENANETDIRAWAVGQYEQLRQGTPAQPLAMILPHTRVADYHVVVFPLIYAGDYFGIGCFFRRDPFDAVAQETLRLCVDVIARAITTERLRNQFNRERQRFEAIFRHTSDGMLLLDETGTTALQANAAFYSLTGIAPSTFAVPASVTTMEEQLSGEMREEPFTDTMQHGRRWYMTPARSDGPHLEIIESTITIGPTRHRLRVFHDVTGFHRAQQARAEFISIISHELRNPLTAIFGFIDLLLRSPAGELTPFQRECLSSADYGMRQLMRLVDDIIGLLQLDLGRLVLERSTMDLEPVVRAVGQSLKPLLDFAQLTIEIEIAAPTPIYVCGDPVRIQQILNNLIINAIKFSRAGTAITLRVDVTADEARVAVHDTGPGIESHDLDRIFQPFVRGEQPSRRHSTGLGLGLTIVEQLVASHNGKVWVESEINHGSTFIFTLPLVDSSSGSHA